VTQRSNIELERHILSDITRLREVLVEILRLPAHSVIDGLTLADTENWDSLAHMELIAAIEQEFAVELSLDDIVGMVSYAKICAVLAGKGLAV
jgi:acyl carrier protein